MDEAILAMIHRLEARVQVLEEREKRLQEAVTADAWPPRPYIGYVPRGTDVIEPPPFHDPVLE